MAEAILTKIQEINDEAKREDCLPKSHEFCSHKIIFMPNIIYTPCKFEIPVYINGKEIYIEVNACYRPKHQQIIINKNQPLWIFLYGIFHELAHHFLYTHSNLDKIDYFLDWIDFHIWLKTNLSLGKKLLSERFYMS